ncbi:MAG: hypothetical protein J1F22_00280 [Lachnospiraceae bacterium]|nr:hypothetical protein [Lachnospiraceae bacterium]
MSRHRKCLLVLGMLAALLAGELSFASAMSAEKHSIRSVEEKTEIEEEPIDETQKPQVSEDPEPTATPVPTAVPEKYELLNQNAKYKKGGQTGIHYNIIKDQKVYHMVSYTTDTVHLSMSHESAYQIYGGGSKKEVKKKYVTVTAGGVVKCHRKGKGQVVCTIIRAKSLQTGEEQFIYIRFKKKLSVKGSSHMTLYEKHSGQLKFDYSYKKLSFRVGNKKKAKVSKKGKVSALRHGVTYVTVKVKDSEKNQVKIKITVKTEPWIVSKKDTVYSYQDMTNDLYQLRRKYGSKTGLTSLGKSWDDRNIWCLRIGNPYASRRLVIDGAIHAREWKNSQLLMRQAEDMLRDYSEYRTRFQRVCIYMIPMANPDGVTLAQYGFGAIRNTKMQKRCEKIGHAAIWKNNARGVNINYNFPSGFSKKGKAKKPDYYSYPGKQSGSEKETKALMAFFNRICPSAVLNIHSTGSIIYWDFNVGGSQHQRLYNLAHKVRSFNKYRMMPKSGSTNGSGGLADWLVYGKNITSITIETGTVRCPLPHSQFDSIYKRNRDMFRWFMTKY